MFRHSFLVLMALALAVSASPVRAQARKGWVQIGQRVVTDRADHDTILVSGAKGNFRTIRIDVTGHAVDFHRVVVHFGSGADQKIELRNTIRSGSSSREIDLEGGNRTIRSIEFWYDAKTIGRGGKAVVRAMGRD